MTVQSAAFLRTTLPLDPSRLEEPDGGRDHSIWLPDHMVSFWPDSIWTPEFTDLATASPSPHRHLDGLAAGGRGRRAHREGSAGQRRGRHGAPSSRTAGSDGPDHRPPRRRPFRPRPGRPRDRERADLRLRFLPTGQPFRGGSAGDPVALGDRRPGRCGRPVLLSAPCPVGHRALRRAGNADLDRGQWPAGARHRGPPRRRLVAGRRLDAGAVRRDAGRGAGLRRTRRARPDGDHGVFHPGVPDRCGRKRAGRDPAGPPGQGIPAAGSRGDVARLRV